MRHLLAVTVILGVPGLAAAQGTPAPRPIVVTGLTSWVGGNCRQAVQAWTSTWSKESGAERLISGCDDFKDFGTLHGYDIIRVVDVTPNLQRVYVLLRYSGQPVYLSLLAYAPDAKTWEVEAVNWNTNPDNIMPPEILPAQHVTPAREPRDSQ